MPAQRLWEIESRKAPRLGLADSGGTSTKPLLERAVAFCTDEDATGGAEGGECAAGGVSVPHPPTPNPGRNSPGRPEDCPPPTVLGEARTWSATPFVESTT